MQLTDPRLHCQPVIGPGSDPSLSLILILSGFSQIYYHKSRMSKISLAESSGLERALLPRCLGPEDDREPTIVLPCSTGHKGSFSQQAHQVKQAGCKDTGARKAQDSLSMNVECQCQQWGGGFDAFKESCLKKYRTYRLATQCNQSGGV